MSFENDTSKLESMRKGAKEMGQRELQLTREYEKCQQNNEEIKNERKRGVSLDV